MSRKYFSEFHRLARSVKALEDTQAKVTEILENYSDAAITKLMRFSHFIDAANAVRTYAAPLAGGV